MDSLFVKHNKKRTWLSGTRKLLFPGLYESRPTNELPVNDEQSVTVSFPLKNHFLRRMKNYFFQENFQMAQDKKLRNG